MRVPVDSFRYEWGHRGHATGFAVWHGHASRSLQALQKLPELQRSIHARPTAGNKPWRTTSRRTFRVLQSRHDGFSRSRPGSSVFFSVLRRGNAGRWSVRGAEFAEAYRRDQRSTNIGQEFGRDGRPGEVAGGEDARSGRCFWAQRIPSLWRFSFYLQGTGQRFVPARLCQPRPDHDRIEQWKVLRQAVRRKFLRDEWNHRRRHGRVLAPPDRNEHRRISFGHAERFGAAARQVGGRRAVRSAQRRFPPSLLRLRDLPGNANGNGPEAESNRWRCRSRIQSLCGMRRLPPNR